MTGCSAIFNHGIEIRQNPKKSIKRDEETPPLWLTPRQLRRPIPSQPASRVRWRLLGPHVNGSLKRTCADLEAKTSRSSIGWAKCAKRSRASGSLSCNASLRPCSSLRLRSSRLLPSNRGGPAQQGSYQDQACRNVQAVSLWPSSTSNSSDRSRGRTQDR